MRNHHDPLSVLNNTDLPLDPDPRFAAKLRARLEAALSLPNRTEGVVMADADAVIADLSNVAAPPVSPRPAIIAYLTVPDARAAIAWYIAALGAEQVGQPVVMDDGRIGHAELSFSGGALYLADEYPELGLKAPAPQSNSVSLMLSVPDVDASLQRARSNGAQIQREPYENHGTRNATLVDPSGHRWMLSGPTAAPMQHGDVGYVSIWAPDPERAAAFYGHVLGWVFEPGGHHVTNTVQHIGVYPMPGLPTLFCCYAVADLDATEQDIVARGGVAGDRQTTEFGTVLDATDPGGTAFAVYQPSTRIPRPAVNGAGPGELSYLTYEVPDATAFKDFYGQVLSWTFEPGRVDDGWAIEGCRPMSGMAGSSPAATTVPMWTVTDIDAAVGRVRAAGGTVLKEPSQQPYGLMAECTDDQGTRFYLGQF